MGEGFGRIVAVVVEGEVGRKCVRLREVGVMVVSVSGSAGDVRG